MGESETHDIMAYLNSWPRFLASLTKSIDKLTSDSADFEQLEQLFEPILHNILLIWRYSKFYTTPTRLAVAQ